MPTAKRFMPVLVANVVLGVPAYPVIFILAYGFRDSVALAEHGSFLVMVAIFAVVTGLLGGATQLRANPRVPVGRLAAFSVLASLALNSAVIGIGSIVSAIHKDEGSVSAAFTTSTDLLVAVGLFVVAAVLAVIARRVEGNVDDS